jgi:hypothetical protein
MTAGSCVLDRCPFMMLSSNAIWPRLNYGAPILRRSSTDGGNPHFLKTPSSAANGFGSSSRLPKELRPQKQAALAAMYRCCDSNEHEANGSLGSPWARPDGDHATRPARGLGNRGCVCPNERSPRRLRVGRLTSEPADNLPSTGALSPPLQGSHERACRDPNRTKIRSAS